MHHVLLFSKKDRSKYVFFLYILEIFVVLTYWTEH